MSGAAAPRTLDAHAVLFDLDGTLADSAGDLTGAVNRVRHERGLPPVAVELVRKHASAGARGMLGAGMGVTPDDPEYPRLRDSFLAHYANGLAETTRLFDGVDALLAMLDARAIRWGIVTNKAMRFTRPVTEALGLAARTVVIVGGDTTPHAKPHPEPLLHAARALGLAPGSVAYVGDDLRDAQAARAAGMPMLAATWGYLGLGEPVHDWGADALLDAPSQLLEWLRGRAR